MKILVTGGGGFLGQHVVAELSRRGHAVVAPSSQTCDLRETRSLFSIGETFDQIYHLAAWTQAGTFCDRRRGEQWIANELINAGVLSYWHAAQPRAKLVAIGTSASYPPGVEAKESNYFQAEPIDSYYAYAQTKRSLAVGLQSLARQFQHRYLYLVPSTLYGPGYPLDGRELHFIYDLIRKILRAKSQRIPAVLLGDGEQRRELVHVRDAARWICDLAETDRADNEIVNLGSGESRSIREFAAMICADVGLSPQELQYDTTYSAGIRHKSLAIGRLNHLLPNRAITPMGQGLSETIAWMRAATA